MRLRAYGASRAAVVGRARWRGCSLRKEREKLVWALMRGLGWKVLRTTAWQFVFGMRPMACR